MSYHNDKGEHVDPNEVLKNMVELARKITATGEDMDALKLADEVLSMHDWLSKGGFFPAAWHAYVPGQMAVGE
jgi:hypothetical protein